MTDLEKFLTIAEPFIRRMRDLGFAHVSVKENGFEAHVEGVTSNTTQAVGGSIGFAADDE